MLNIYIVRHGQDEDNQNGILNGHRDMPLTELGKTQAQQLAQKIKNIGIHFDKAYSSPLQRAYITGKIITESATRDLIKAGADGVKVGIGPGAMCTTRMKTGVGRPQFTAVYKCAQEAKKHGGFVRADGGIRSPRDMNLALAAGANHVMRGSLFAGTFESVGDVKYDMDGSMYKDNYGMASKKAVSLRNQNTSKFELSKREMFREGISTSKIYIKKGRESVGDIVDDFVAGLRSAMTYVGANNLEEFNKKAIVGVQTNAGFSEGEPLGKMK